MAQGKPEIKHEFHERRKTVIPEGPEFVAPKSNRKADFTGTMKVIPQGDIPIKSIRHDQSYNQHAAMQRYDRVQKRIRKAGAK